MSEIRDIKQDIRLKVDLLCKPGYDAEANRAKPALIALLRYAIRNKVSTDAGSRRLGISERLPINVKAFDLYRSVVEQWGNPPEVALNTYINGIYNVFELDQLKEDQAYFTKLVASVESVLDKPRNFHLWVENGKAAPCPQCNTSMVYRPDSTNQMVRIPALSVNTIEGAVCANCGETWEPHRLAWLARTLGCTGEVDLLASESRG